MSGSSPPWTASKSIVINAHASEVSSCTLEEQERVLAATVDKLGGRTHIVNGVYPEGSLEAARVAKMAERGGASALLVFPPGIFNGGANLRPEIAVNHYRYIADACDLPIIIFQFRVAEIGHSHEVLHRLVEEVPSICGIKDVSDHPVFLERTIRELQSGPRPISVLARSRGCCARWCWAARAASLVPEAPLPICRSPCSMRCRPTISRSPNALQTCCTTLPILSVVRHASASTTA